LGVYKNVSLSLWLGNATVADLLPIRQQYQALANSMGRFGSLVVIHAVKNEHVSNEVRQAAAVLRKDFSSHLLAEANVIEAKGFLATTARLTMRAIRLLKPPSYPCEIFDQSQDAVDWVAKHSKLPPLELHDAFHRLKRDAGLL
jgi:hypothetical protein